MFIKTLIFCSFAFVFITLAQQDEITPWEKLGISKTEWLLIQDNKIPMSKVGELLTSGIGIGEYVDRPWLKLNMSESKWISKRRSGLTQEEIERKVRHHQPEMSWKELNRENARDDIRAVSKNGEKFSSLFLPGYQQGKNGRKVTRTFMVGFTAASLTGCVAWSIATQKFQPIPIFAVTIPTMVWSFVDHSVYSRK